MRGCTLFTSCGRLGAIHGASVTSSANAFHARSHRTPRFSVTRGPIVQSSCAHAPYLGIEYGVLNSPDDTPTLYRVVIEESAFRFQVSALNASGKIVCSVAAFGAEAELAVSSPMHHRQLRV